VQDKWDIKVNPGDLYAFCTKHGKRSERVTRMLESNADLYEAFSSKLGKVMLKDTMEEMDGLFEKIVSLEATDQEKVEYKVLREKISLWASRINAYRRAAQMIEGDNK
jgi:hypothetical protein